MREYGKKTARPHGFFIVPMGSDPSCILLNMYLRGAMGNGIIAILIGSLFVCMALSAHAADTMSGSEACNNPNLRPADRAVLKCDDRASALAYLKSLREGTGGKCQTTSDPSFEMLNPTFTVCAAQFLKEFETRYGKVKITSAGRSAAQQKCVCPVAIPGKCGSVGSSNHQRALALDVHPANGNYMQMQAFARANPAFGVCFPLGERDRPHMILAGIGGGESNNCAAQGITKPCAGAPTLVVPAPLTSEQAPPTAAFSDSIRQALGMPTQQNGVTASPSLPAQALSSSQTPLQAFDDTNTNSPSLIGTSLGNTSHATSAADELEDLAFGHSAATSTGTATSVPLIVSGANAATLSTSQNTNAGPAVTTQGVSSPSQTTFISGDLSWQNEGTSESRPLSGTAAILATIKATLQRILQYLVPFGTRSTDLYGESSE
jgi:hypothetical protein